MNPLAIIGCGLLGFGIVLVLTSLALRFCPSSKRERDFHHSHNGRVPRLGGLALAGAWIGVEIFIRLLFPQETLRIPCRNVAVLSSLAMFGLGFWDDLKALGAKRKLIGQVLISLTVYYAGVGIETIRIPFSGHIIALNGWGAPVTVLWLVGITNLINLIDGVDGLATGICLMLMSLLVYVGYQNGTFVLLTAGMTGALLAFLWFNFPPARMFLGDGGAYFLGFQIGLFALVSSHKGSVFAALIAPLFVLALPIVDTSLAILRRGLRGLPLFRADRRHLHHHLLSMGMSRRKVVLLFYGMTLLFLGMGFAAFCSDGQLVPVLLGLAAALLLLCAGQLSFSREWFAVGRTLGNSLAMRQEIHYALALMNCLKHEARRCRSLSDLYEELVLAAQRLGFTTVKVRLTDGERVWEDTRRCGTSPRCFRQELNGGCGVAIELQGPACFGGEPCSSPQPAHRRNGTCQCPNPADGRLFGVIAELVAEGWVRAAAKSRNGRPPRAFNESAVAGLGNGARPSRFPLIDRLQVRRAASKAAADDSATESSL